MRRLIINGRVDATGIKACMDSVCRAASVLEGKPQSDGFTQIWDIGERGQLATAVLAENGCIILEPRECVAPALAAICATHTEFDVRIVHGWPVLLLGSDSTSMTEAGGANNLASGGLA